MRLKTPSKGAFRNIGAAVAHWASVEPSVASETWYPESQTFIAAHPSRRPLRGLLRMRSNLLNTTASHASVSKHGQQATHLSLTVGTRAPFRFYPNGRGASRAAARPTASVRRACPGAIRSFISASTSGGAVSGEPELNGGAGLYSSRS